MNIKDWKKSEVRAESVAFPGYSGGGMDLRTYVATQIASGLASISMEHIQEAGQLTGMRTEQIVAKAAVTLADALIAELNR